MNRAARRWGVAGAVLTVAVVSAGAAWWVDDHAASPLTSDTPVQALIVATQTGERVGRFAVGLAVTNEDGFTVTAAATGTVTSVPVTTGTIATGGTVLAYVDDLPVLAYTGDGPLWRDLTPGTEGQDVARLQEYLTQLGLYSATPNGKYGPSTASAVKKFNARHGRKDVADTFQTSSVAWIGPQDLPVVSVDVKAGAVVGPGTVLVTGPGRPVAVTVTEPAGGIPPGSEYQLNVADVSVPYVPGTGAVTDADASARIAAALGTSGEGAGQVVTTVGEQVLQVPAAAVVVGPDGATCVFTDPLEAPVPVEVVGGTLAHADLAVNESITQVVANPLAALEDPTCTSSPTR